MKVFTATIICCALFGFILHYIRYFLKNGGSIVHMNKRLTEGPNVPKEYKKPFNWDEYSRIGK